MTKEFKIRFKEPMRAIRWDSNDIEGMKKYFDENAFARHFGIFIEHEHGQGWSIRTSDGICRLHDGDVVFADDWNGNWDMICDHSFHEEFEEVGSTKPQFIQNTEEST